MRVQVDVDKYHMPVNRFFFYVIWNRTFLVEQHKDYILIKLVANFTVTDVKECTQIFNNKSCKTPLKYYMVTLINANGKVEKDVKIANNSKSDFRQFQSDINTSYNDFTVNMAENEFKSFVAEYISPKVSSSVIIYTNAGLLENNTILYKNALATDTEIL